MKVSPSPAQRERGPGGEGKTFGVVRTLQGTQLRASRQQNADLNWDRLASPNRLPSPPGPPLPQAGEGGNRSRCRAVSQPGSAPADIQRSVPEIEEVDENLRLAAVVQDGA